MTNQKGIAHMFVLLLLLGGVVLGTYLIANRTNIIPNASETSAPVSSIKPAASVFPEAAKKCLSNNDCSQGYECTTKDLKPLPSDGCKGTFLSGESKNSKNPNCEATMSAKRQYGICHKIEPGQSTGSASLKKNRGNEQEQEQNEAQTPKKAGPSRSPKPSSRP